jgi:hypothetical protein
MHCCHEHAGQNFAAGLGPRASRWCALPGGAGWRFVVRQPEEIEEREHESAVARVAAVDVAEASGVVCTRVPREGEPGRW